ncbi:hypothetical protein IE994_23855 [Enterobacter hormaechei]|uniref:Enolase N-terminal domain-containing protein n=1 Tax=Enterobacter hormaechei TaxID=158836 RepID=A0A927DJN7_9ENTR|nr:hypothetical protein [Enterobacter hormaechei]MBD3707666.1 hypothetical protein [Enterobacter hormaechei]MBD3717532.1 hypothetical protein [Enterobacter hormaechei]
MVKTAITALIARKVWSSSGLPALEIEVFIDKRISARAITQSGLSGGYVDPILNSENLCANLHKMLDCKIQYINKMLTPQLLGQRIDDQLIIDSILSLSTQNNKLSHADTAAISIAVADLAAGTMPFRYGNTFNKTILNPLCRYQKLKYSGVELMHLMLQQYRM